MGGEVTLPQGGKEQVWGRACTSRPTREEEALGRGSLGGGAGGVGGEGEVEGGRWSGRWSLLLES